MPSETYDLRKALKTLPSLSLEKPQITLIAKGSEICSRYQKGRFLESWKILSSPQKKISLQKNSILF